MNLNNVNVAGLESLLANTKWLVENEQKIKELLPETWTNVQNIDPVRIGFGLKLIGLDWRSNDDLAYILVRLEELKLLLRENYIVSRNPSNL